MTDTTAPKGLVLDIYRNQHEASNNGLSKFHQEVTVVGVSYRDGGPRQVRPLPLACRVFTPTEQRPAVVLVYREMGEGERLVHVEPFEPARGVGFMAGGTFVATSDSRWRELVGFYGAVAFHDQDETPEQYRALSSD
jgi:hypothetical protein